MKTATIVYARLDSARLSEKALREFGGIPLLEIVLKRAARCGQDELVFATSYRSIDDRIADLAQKCGATVVRGSFEDLVDRTVLAIDKLKIDCFARINGDSPFVDPELIANAFSVLADQQQITLATNLFARTYPYGVAVEVVRSSCYRDLASQAIPAEREHTTQHLYRLLNADQIHSIVRDEDSVSNIRLTVDTEEDATQLLGFYAKSEVDPIHVSFTDALSHFGSTHRFL